jgi:hypothetical protein
MLTCLKHSCQRHAFSSPCQRTIKHVDCANFKWRRYKRFSSYFAFASSTPPGSRIFITPVSISIL